MNYLIFDLGGVLVSFDAKKMLAEKGLCNYYDKLFPDLWNEYDRGCIVEKDMVADYPELEDLMAHWTDFLNPLALADVHFDCPVYILSNLPEKAYCRVKELGILDGVSGGVFSFQEGLIKPEKEIYTRLLERYDLDPSHGLMIDDRLENVIAARACGLQAHLHQDVERTLEVIAEWLVQ